MSTTQKMDPKIRDEWVRRLRSGAYRQGLSVLNNGSGRFCCLGVLCEIAVEAGVATKNYDWDVVRYVGEVDERQEGVLPLSVRDWSGLPSTVGVFGDDSLANRNDCGTSFAEIADLIEEHF